MFARSIVESAKFLKLPATSQLLYFHLGMNADDDGVVEAYSVLRIANANEDDLEVLAGRGFVKVLNEDYVTYIFNWRKHNNLRADRKVDSVYKELLLRLLPEEKLLEKKQRSDVKKISGLSVDRPWTEECSVGKNSVVQDSIEEVSVVDDKYPHTPKYKLDKEILTNLEYDNLVKKYSQKTVDKVINRILDKPYHGCLNEDTISKWCVEHYDSAEEDNLGVLESEYSGQLMRLAEERIGG